MTGIFPHSRASTHHTTPNEPKPTGFSVSATGGERVGCVGTTRRAVWRPEPTHWDTAGGGRAAIAYLLLKVTTWAIASSESPSVLQPPHRHYTTPRGCYAHAQAEGKYPDYSLPRARSRAKGQRPNCWISSDFCLLILYFRKWLERERNDNDFFSLRSC